MVEALSQFIKFAVDLDTFTLLPGWIILTNLGARRQKSQVLRPCFDLVDYSLSGLCRLLVSHHLWSETRQTRYSMGVTARLESALDLVNKTECTKGETLERTT